MTFNVSEEIDYSGPFKKGFDPRRGKGGNKRIEVYKHQTISELADLHTNDAIHVLACIMNGRDPDDANGETRAKYATASKIKAAAILLAYAHGKPVDSIKIQEISNSAGGIEHLTTPQLLTLIKQEQPVEEAADT